MSFESFSKGGSGPRFHEVVIGLIILQALLGCAISRNAPLIERNAPLIDVEIRDSVNGNTVPVEVVP